MLAFLCGVARNRIMHHLRKNKERLDFRPEENDDFIELPDDTGRNPLEVLLEHELETKVNEGIKELPPLQREAIILREMQEFSYEEIAKITGDDVNAVKVRLHRARRNLARRIAPYLKTEKKTEKESCYEMQ